jgi:hypothetical protein
LVTGGAENEIGVRGFLESVMQDATSSEGTKKKLSFLNILFLLK